MNLVDRHIFTEWLLAFALALGAILGILILFDVSDNLKDLIEFGAGTGGIMRYYAMLTPTLLPAVLPIALMVSILYSLGNLHRNNEIVALRAAGLSLWRITRSLWLAGLALTFILFYLNAQLVPLAVEGTHRLWDEYTELHSAGTTEQKKESKGEPLAFYNDSSRRLWYINHYDAKTREAQAVTVSQLDGRQREISRLYANSAKYDSVHQSWTFRDGRELTYDPDGADPGDAIRAHPFTRLELPRFTENPIVMRTLDKRPKDLSFNELGSLLTQIPASDTPQMRAYEMRYHSTLTTPFACLIVAGLAIPFAVAGVRTNPLVGVSKSIGLFALYYVIASLSGLIGNRGILPPALAAWLPNMLMLLGALYFSRKAV